ncbi:DUF573 family protein [Medicago truncatula]|uniref:DUF573 family protein n=1 Tax=Medicago truncatula TaxID=3880 RepID=G7I7E6_MEDTR|nr:DUF573 family protein [Medicago truncatula]
MSTFATTAAIPTTIILALPNTAATANVNEDEITILQGFLDYNVNRGSSYHNDIGSFYDQIKFRRLKKNHCMVLHKFDFGKDFAFKRAHYQATFEISHKI